MLAGLLPFDCLFSHKDALQHFTSKIIQKFLILICENAAKDSGALPIISPTHSADTTVRNPVKLCIAKCTPS